MSILELSSFRSFDVNLKKVAVLLFLIRIKIGAGTWQLRNKGNVPSHNMNLFERLIDSRIRQECEILECRYRFRSGHGTMDFVFAWIILEKYWMTLRWGIATAGKISNDFVNALNSYPEKGDQEVVGIAARDMNRANDFAKIHNIDKVFSSYKALARSGDIDVVYIGALNPEHYTLARLFLEYGKHVLCEKPFCMNYKQTQNLINFANERKLFLMEGIWSRFSPAYIDLEQDLKSGKFGNIKLLKANFGINTDAERLYKKEQGGGALLDVGIYLLHLSQFVFQEEPTNITAFSKLFDSGVDESETIILEYSGGRKAVLNANSKLQLENKATIYGTKGRFTLEQPFHFPLKVTDMDGTVKEYELHPSKLAYNFENSAGLAYEAMEVANCIKAGLLESPSMPHKDTAMLSRLMDTIRKQIGVHYDVDDGPCPCE